MQGEGTEHLVTPGDDPEVIHIDADPVPAFPERQAQREQLERSDRDILIDIQERLVRLENVTNVTAQLAIDFFQSATEAVKRDGIVGIARVIPELIKMTAAVKQTPTPEPTPEPEPETGNGE